MLAYGVHLDLNCVLMSTLMMILPFLGLFFWLENKVSNSKEDNHYSKGKEVVQMSAELIDSIFSEQDEENASQSVVRAHCACSFCGRLSDTVTRCSRCMAALYCSNVCLVAHWRFWHENECNEIEEADNGTFLLMEPGNETSNYSFNEFEEKTYEGDVYYIEEEQNCVECSDKTAMPWYGFVNGVAVCTVCGNPSSKRCSRCKVIKYCSQTCQHFDWRSGHKFHCFAEKANSTQAATLDQERHAHENIVKQKNFCEVEDDVYSSNPLRLEFYSVGDTNYRALILSSLSQEATNNDQKELEEQLRTLIEELAKIKDENTSLRLERDEWEMQARNSMDRLYNLLKESDHKLFSLKHENELISNAEKQARQMVNNLSHRLHRLQVAVETQVAERKKQEEYIHELKVSQPIGLSRNPTFTRQGCSICLTNEKDMAFGCGHMTCGECGSKIRKCHICRKKVTIRIRLFPD